MKQSTTITATGSLPNKKCANCDQCSVNIGSQKQAALTAAKALYHSEVETYYFYFYQQLMYTKNGFNRLPAMDV